MKTRVVGLIWALGGCLGLWAAEPISLELKGIVQFPKSEEPAKSPGLQSVAGRLVALIEFQSRPQRTREEFALLGEGQRQADVEVIKIDTHTGTVQARVNGESRELSLALPNSANTAASNPAANQGIPVSSGSIRLKEATRREALEIYQQLVGRTLLMSSAVGRANKITFRTDEAAPREELAKGLEKAMDGLVFHPDGEKFIVVGSEGDFEKLTPELRELARKLAPASQSEAERVVSAQLIPAGMINFMGTDLNQVLMIFQELANRTLLRPARFPGSGIFLRTETPLTRGEATYALCGALALDGVSFVDLGDKFVFAYPSSEEAKRKALFARKLPSHADAPAGAALQVEIPRTTVQMELGTMARVYGKLLGQPVEVGQEMPSSLFVFRTQQPLTTIETLYAFDLLLAWEGLQVVKNSDGGLKLARVE